MCAHSVFFMKIFQFRTVTERFLEGLNETCVTNHREEGNSWAFKDVKFSVPIKY